MPKKKIVYDRHAKRRMKWRKISTREVDAVMANPDRIESTEKGRINAIKKIKDRLIKVTYKENDIILIISAVDKND